MVLQEPTLMRIPAEIRLMIYRYLLDAGDHNRIAICSQPLHQAKKSIEGKRRSHYNVLDKSPLRCAYKTTYGLEGEAEFHPAILAVNRRIREEASHCLYAANSFHFGSDIDAVVPFLGDMTSSTLSLINEITLRKQKPISPWETDSCAWNNICGYLSTMPNLSKLRLIIEGGRPRHSWDGPQELSLSDFRFLYSTRHECLDWARTLAAVGTIGEVEIVADMQYMAEPTGSEMFVFAAFSASIETTLVEFLSTDLNISACTGVR